MSYPNILLVDADETFRSSLLRQLQKSDACGAIYSTGHMEEALLLIANHRIDVLITDLFIFGGDGLALITQFHRINRNAIVVLMSALLRSGVINETVLEDIDLLLTKPCSVTSVCDSLNGLLNHDVISNRRRSNLDADLSEILRSLGIAPHVKGYHYLKEAIMIVLRNPSAADGVTKMVYPEIARKYQTSTINVERAIRYAIYEAWQKYRHQKWKLYFTETELNRERPSNATVICVLAEYYRLYGAEYSFAIRTNP